MKPELCCVDQQDGKNKNAKQPTHFFWHPNIHDLLPGLNVCDTKFIVIKVDKSQRSSIVSAIVLLNKELAATLATRVQFLRDRFTSLVSFLFSFLVFCLA